MLAFTSTCTIALTSCGTAATAVATAIGTGSGVTVPPTVRSGIDSTTNFGASITCGVGATVPANGYASLLDAAIGAPSADDCRGGDEAADTTRAWVYPNAVPVLGAHQLYTVLVGSNDANGCGPSSGCMANWYNSMEASLAWLALPASDKTVAVNAAARTGNWSADTATGVAGLSTTANGATLSFTVNQVVPGHHLYVAYRVYDAASSNPGTASLTVDGVQAATLSSAVGTGQSLSTPNATTDTIFVASVALGATGNHAVKLTTTSTGGGTFALQWVGVASANYAGNSAAPRVVVGQITASTSASLNATIATYNATLSPMVSALTADGMFVTVAPTASVLNASGDFTDLLHPNDVGHLLVAQAFAGVL